MAEELQTDLWLLTLQAAQTRHTDRMKLKKTDPKSQTLFQTSTSKVKNEP